MPSSAILVGDWLTMGMLLSLPVLAFGAWLVIRAYRNDRRWPRAHDRSAVTSELGRLIARRIALTGPISVADFMAEALGHPRLGYYRQRAAARRRPATSPPRRRSPRCSAS